MIKFAIFILSSLLLVTYVSADVIQYGECRNTVASSSFTYDVQWVTRDADTSTINYNICAPRASDLRYSNNVQISVYRSLYSQMKTIERVISLCPNGATPCALHLDANQCIRGSLDIGIPLPSTAIVNGITPRSEIVLSEGSGGIALLRICSL